MLVPDGENIEPELPVTVAGILEVVFVDTIPPSPLAEERALEAEAPALEAAVLREPKKRFVEDVSAPATPMMEVGVVKETGVK